MKLSFIHILIPMLSLGVVCRGAEPIPADRGSIRVRPGKASTFGETSIQLLAIEAAGSPNATLSLKSVQNGEEVLLQTFRFEAMKRGSLALYTTPLGVELNVDDVECTRMVSNTKAKGLVPPGAIYAGESWGETPALEKGQEQTVWKKAFFLNKKRNNWTSAEGAFRLLLETSKQNPDMITYVVTIKVDETYSDTIPVDKNGLIRQ